MASRGQVSVIAPAARPCLLANAALNQRNGMAVPDVCSATSVSVKHFIIIIIISILTRDKTY